MKKGLIVIIAIVAVIAILGGSLVSTYNGLVDKQANVENADAQIQVQLQRRADLIPNLVNTVKAYAAHEEDVYTALADARASNEKVNFEIEKLKIEANARIEIATKTAQIMAEIGKNAEFVNIGGTGVNGQTGNVLLDTLAGVPGLMKTLDVENQALNGKSFNEELNALVAAIADPVKGVLSTSTTNNTTINEAKTDSAE